MEPQSLYTYFHSKNALYDALFAEAYAELLSRQRAAAHPDPQVAFTRIAHAFVHYCTEDPVRYLLLFQRTVPGFTPGPDGMRSAVEVLDLVRDILARLGIGDPEALDVLTAVLGGIAAQQTANEPGGRRWTGLTDRAVTMFLREFAPDR
ncbi:hypothetical protein BIV57_00690 [Mangrovactinospora gilvigrisea]|uniref:TetR family transcriptional regulator n=2 Tax=Mangrovactinospora gilvigrisea TaxID=1428644 RepID=A0A1J7C1A3_9ACTN|nr:hypothetical protein BIV57_00690 [Mangrovactinospora gilvigrisea]